MHLFDLTSKLARPIAILAIGLWLPAAAVAARGVAPETDAPGVASSSIPAVGPAVGACEITDRMPDFWHFWQAAQGAPRETWPALFRDLVRQPNAALYDAVFRNYLGPSLGGLALASIMLAALVGGAAAADPSPNANCIGQLFAGAVQAGTAG